MKIYDNITSLIGKTPLVELKNIEREYNLNSRLLAKLEYFNPVGSAKDRIAYAMIEDAKNKGILKENSTIIEPTSGNTGIALAAIGASLGYKVILTMPDTMSVERRNLIKAFGAQVVLTEGKYGMKGAIEKAKELSREIENSYIPSQFTNPANPKIHYETTGREIWEDTEGKIDIFIAGVGTGGTISGCGKYLKSKNPDIKIIALEPYDSPVLSQNKSASHKIQGIGAGFVPETLDRSIYDEIITVKNEDAFKGAKLIAKKEGYLTGISSGAAIYAALETAKKETNKTIVAFLPDTGERYLSNEDFVS